MGVDVVKVAVLDRTSHADARLEFGQIFHDLIHLDVHVVVEDKPKAPFFIVLAEKHHLPAKVRVVQKGLAQEHIACLGRGLVGGGESNHVNVVETKLYDKVLTKFRHLWS